jgi:alpha,alpha-trehalase
LRTQIERSLLVFFVLLFLAFARPSQLYPSQATKAGPTDRDILAYIGDSWHRLTRSTRDCASLIDPKLPAGKQSPLYLPSNMSPTPDLEALQNACNVPIAMLPRRIAHLGDVSPNALPQPGLLYLPYPYVVPGGRFNEMYGWDSYFIIRGLIEDGQLDLAREMVENFFFEIENYGAILNANRTYYLTRSQPPFLTSMILAVYNAEKNAGRPDREWLATAYAYAERDYRLWTQPPKVADGTELSRYFDVGTGPVPEIADHPEYYATVADWLIRHPQSRTGYLATNRESGIGPDIRVPLCGETPCANSKAVRFTADYYKGDRAMRESGFDISFRFGPFGGSTHHFIPVCLNSLLYKAEKDLETMAGLLDRPHEALLWRGRAVRRRQRVNRFLWNPRLGMFTDFDFKRHQASDYRFATTFYPLWAGLASKAQAKAVMKNLAIFEQPGGIAMSDRQTGVQWDKPYAWAPIQMLAVEGMRRYGFQAEADRITKEFLTMVRENFLRDGTIREKYNAVKRSTEVDITAGYTSNVVGFGWTNAAFLVLLHELGSQDQKSILMAGSHIRKEIGEGFFVLTAGPAP